jgi:hypothetical protein
MNANDRRRLTRLAKLMVGEAQSSDSDRILSATGFARENISILHQQMRCANLAWALRHIRKIRRGDVVAIVGGSFSGLMLACSLAIADDIIVYLFEKDKRPLNRFLDKSHRHLSPNLNSRYLGVRFDPINSAPFYNPAIFAWKPGAANDVAHEWLKNFETYRSTLPIFVFHETEIKPEDIQRLEQRIRIKWTESPHLQPVDVDLLIDATGFGEEANPHRLADYSYWEAGHRLIYDHLPKDCRVLVSGCGDSGIIEALHYAIKDFRHEFVEDLWPSGVNLEPQLDVGLEDSKLDDLLLSQEIDRYDGQVISELCWWLDNCHLRANFDDPESTLREDVNSIFEAIDSALQPHLLKAFSAQKLKQLEWDEREAFLLQLDIGAQLAIREKVMPLVDPWISKNIESLVREIPPPIASKLHELHGRRRSGVQVTLNGIMPTPYTRQMSTYNVWLTRVFVTFPNVNYRQGRISNIEAEDSGLFTVTYEGKAKEVYDRVVTRYGPASPSGRRLSNKTPPDPHRGNWLLTSGSYNVPTEDPHVCRRIDPAKDDVARKLGEVLRRRGSRRVHSVHKMLYKSRLLLGPQPVTSSVGYLDSDPQTWLSSKLRSGVRPSYEENFELPGKS